MPILLVGGWYDSYTRATFQNFVGLGAGGRRPVRALIGPWTHGGKTMELSYAGDVEFAPEAALPSFTSRPCATCCRCPPASRTRATPAAASAPPTSCARAASTSARPPDSTAAARPAAGLPGRRAVFQTEPLREPTEVTGPIEVHLWVATSAVDTDFTAS